MSEQAVLPLQVISPVAARPAGCRMVLDARQPRAMDDPSAALRIIAGYVDLFAVPVTDGVAGARHHICRIEAPGILVGLPPVTTETRGSLVTALGVAGQGTEAELLDRIALGRDELEHWVSSLAEAIGTTGAAWETREAISGNALVLKPAEVLRAPTIGVAWVQVDNGTLRFLGGSLLCQPGDPPFPLAAGTWLVAEGDATVFVRDDAAATTIDRWGALDRFHAAVMDLVADRMEAAANEARTRVGRRAEQATAFATLFMDHLASVGPSRRVTAAPRSESDPLLAACGIVAEKIGVALGQLSVKNTGRPFSEQVAEVARAARLGSRTVLLRQGWWKDDVGPLVAARGDREDPVAIVPVSSRRYVIVDPRRRTARSVDPQSAAELGPQAVMLYRPLPTRGTSVTAALTASLRGGMRDLARIAVGALAIGALFLAFPLATQVLVNEVIASAEIDQLTFCAGALAVAALGIGAFRAILGIAALRLESNLNRALQSGTIDQLLRLPVSFFRRHAAGDLADRILGIEATRHLVTAQSIRCILSVAVAIFSFVLMFWYDLRLAVLAAGLTTLHAALIAAVSIARVRRERRHFELDGKVQGFVVQLLTGVGKLRLAAAVDRVSVLWARQFVQQKREFIASRRIANLLTVFEGGFPIAAILLIFAAVRSSAETHQLDIGQFLAFFAAFGLSLAAVSELANALGNILVAIPRFDRLRPVLAEPVEVAAPRNPPGELHGAIELKELTFRYTAGGPAILDKLSLHIEPREHVAIVGPSGSGKSTLFRLLLGFEKPDEGAIFFDGKAIETLDIGALRRQIGVVLQNGKLVSGSLYENICAGGALPLERAMEAARLAGLESDIAAMPMGIHTMIGEGMNTLSGGQQQRLMIARALVHRPRIILFDEATSALDNRTQAIVSASLEKLNVTRVVIAQRLSTVQRADRILVLKGGAVVQSGRFDELLNTPGMFADFAKRQML